MVDVVYVKAAKAAPIIEVVKNEPVDKLCTEFRTWLLISKKGDRYRYYKGKFIAGSRVGKAALTAYDKGEVLLFQKRIGAEFEYWAERRDTY